MHGTRLWSLASVSIQTISMKLSPYTLTRKQTHKLFRATLPHSKLAHASRKSFSDVLLTRSLILQRYLMTLVKRPWKEHTSCGSGTARRSWKKSRLLSESCEPELMALSHTWSCPHRKLMSRITPQSCVEQEEYRYYLTWFTSFNLLYLKLIH